MRCGMGWACRTHFAFSLLSCVFYCALLSFDGEQIREVLNSERCAQLSENKRGAIEIFHNVAHSEHFEIVSGTTPHIFSNLCKLNGHKQQSTRGAAILFVCLPACMTLAGRQTNIRLSTYSSVYLPA